MTNRPVLKNNFPNKNINSERDDDNKQPENYDARNVTITKGAIPELLRIRLTARVNARVYWIFSLVLNCIMVILAGFYFDCYYYTRKYITDGDYFWDFNIKHNLSNKAIPLNAMLTGMICILTFVFNLMNLIVIGLYIIFGGVRDRIIFASKF